jgi:hypothetical protein
VTEERDLELKTMIIETPDEPDVDRSNELVGDFWHIQQCENIILPILKPSEPSTSITNCLKESSTLTMHQIRKPQIRLYCTLLCALITFLEVTFL